MFVFIRAGPLLVGAIPPTNSVPGRIKINTLDEHGRAWVINFGGVSFMRDRIMDFFQHFSDKQKNFYSYQSSITFFILFTHVMYQFTIYFDLKYI